MSLLGEQILLRIYLQSADRAPHLPTFQRILKAARSEKLAGTTILRGILGFGFHGLIHSSTWSVVQHEPIIIEIVDTPEKIAAFIRNTLDHLMVGGMLTLERAAVMMYRQRAHDQPNTLRLGACSSPYRRCPRSNQDLT